MTFAELLDIIGDDPVFDTSMLRVGNADPTLVALQLSRWVSTGKLLRLRRGVYAVAEPYRRRKPQPFEVANLLVRPSYVSLESALAFHSLIPEAVYTTTSVTTARPAHYSTALGEYDFRHVAQAMFWGYAQTELPEGKSGIVALPEKALLDLVYLRPGGSDPAFLRQLRLSRLEELDTERLDQMAQRSGKPRLVRAASMIARLAAEQAEEFEEL